MAMAKRTVVPRYRADRQKWEVDYRDHHGKRHRPLLASEELALAHAADVAKTLSQTPALVDDADVTLEAYVTRWLEAGTREMESKTVSSYRQLLRLHVLPAIGHLRLRDLHRRHVKALMAAKRAERLPRKTDQGRDSEAAAPAPAGYSRNTVRLIKAALSTVLSDAVDEGYVPTNAAFGAGRKRGRSETMTQADRLQKIRPMSWDDRDALLGAAAADRRHAALFATLAKAGLRPGEGFALKPTDIDFKNLTGRVERAATDDGSIKATKTHEMRIVDLTPDLAAALKRHVTWLRAEALRTGTGEPEWLFPKADGTLMDKNHAAAIFRRLLKHAGLPHYRVYDLRHTFASLLLAEGAPITYVAAQLGHSSPATTLRYYAKWIPSKGRRWVNSLDRSASRDVGGAAKPASADAEPESGTSAKGTAASV
jgi:integrase